MGQGQHQQQLQQCLPACVMQISHASNAVIYSKGGDKVASTSTARGGHPCASEQLLLHRAAWQSPLSPDTYVELSPVNLLRDTCRTLLALQWSSPRWCCPHWRCCQQPSPQQCSRLQQHCQSGSSSSTPGEVWLVCWACGVLGCCAAMRGLLAATCWRLCSQRE
jgi:hypothetical protein